MKDLSPDQRQVIEATKSALLAHKSDPRDFLEIQSKFSDILKTNFENRNIWLRYGLTISLSKCSPHSALQAYNECMRIDQDDPLPAMLAAKVLLEDLDEPEKALETIEESIKRCKRLMALGDGGNPLLSRSYLLASITHAYTYEREPEYIKQYKEEHLKESLRFLELALETNLHDHLAHFHKALHQVKQRNYSTAIDNLRFAIQISPHHIPTMQLLILTLSALNLNDEALMLCESTLHEHEDNLMLLYLKCNLEQRLVGTRGYKTALSTAQYMLKCLRRSQETKDSNNNNNNENSNNNNNNNNTMNHPSTTIISADTLLQQNQPNHQHQPSSSQPGELSIWLHIAEIFVNIGSIEDAEMCADEASIYAIGPLSHRIMFVRGLIAKARGNLIEAKTFFQSCLALCPRHAMALQQVAHVYYLLGNYSTAEKFLRDSLDLDADCYKTWHYLSLVLIELKQHKRASECAKKSTLLEESAPVVAFSTIPRLTLQ